MNKPLDLKRAHRAGDFLDCLATGPVAPLNQTQLVTKIYGRSVSNRTRQGAVQILYRLLGDGLIARTPGVKGNAVHYHITEAGIAALAEYRAETA